jgi:lytic murein transglycosylase
MRDSSLSTALTLALLGALAAATPAAADFSDCMASVRGEAMAAGVSAATFDSATRGLIPNDAASFLDTQPEFTTPIWDYLVGLVDEDRISDGRARLRDHATALASAEKIYGVDRATIVAVWGVESDFGRGVGKRPLVQSLATLSCEGRRQAYFRTELFATLKIIQSGDVPASALIGSWAGAFGHTQFMPSTFLRFAVDHDGDGRRDVVGSIPDALGSTANYLRSSGWEPEQVWGFEVTIPRDYSGPTGRKAKQSMTYWAGRGVRRVDGKPLGGGMAGLLQPAGPEGPSFLVTNNFDAIFSYNASVSYALAIAHLSDRLRGGGPFATPWPTDDLGLSRAERRELQNILTRRGYDIGPADGVIGEKTRQAIGDFQTKAGLARDGRPGTKLLNLLRAAQ